MSEQCQAAECSAEPYWRAKYRVSSKCDHWPSAKLFCAKHGVDVARSWVPPDNRGYCYECLAPMRLTGVEVL